MGQVVNISVALAARVRAGSKWKLEVERLLGEAGVWPEETGAMADDLWASMPLGSSAKEACQFQLKKMGWIQDEDDLAI